MADRIVVMNHGVIEQIGTPEEIYRSPRTPFVADFIGRINLLPGTLRENGRVEFADRAFSCPPGSGLAPGAKVEVGIRPEAIRLVTHNAARNGASLTARVVDFHEPPEDLGLFDAILGADILYDDGMLRGVLRFIRRHLAPGGLAILADPMRVLPGGVAGAARLSGLEGSSTVLRPGTVVSGGITLYELWRRRPA